MKTQTISPACLATATALLVASAPALAQTTYVVDDDGGPGVDFTEIQPALAVAQFTDVVEVRAGTYGAFTMTSPTRILGDPGATVSGTSAIDGIAPSEWTVVAGLEFERLRVRNSPGTVILDDVDFSGQSLVLGVTQAADVRGRDLVHQGTGPTGTALITIDASNVQLSDSTFICRDAGSEEDGADGIRLTTDSFLHLSDCVVAGGRGGDYLPLLFSRAGDGGVGILARDGSRVRLVGGEVRGGGGGFGDLGAFPDGFHGAGLNACGGVQEVWGCNVEGGLSVGSVNPQAPDYTLNCGATLVDSVPLPTLHQGGPALAGSPLLLEARAEPLASARLIFGRFPVRVTVPGSATPRLVDVGRLASLGAIPASGVIPITFNIPAWPAGTVVFLQTSRTIGGDTQMSGGVAVVVR